jgi:hypothetical protein
MHLLRRKSDKNPNLDPVGTEWTAELYSAHLCKAQHAQALEAPMWIGTGMEAWRG